MTKSVLLTSGFGAAEIILVVACALFVVGVAVVGVIRKKKGKSSCDCGNCLHCSACCKKTDVKEEKEN